jgi:hypothetical protein
MTDKTLYCSFCGKDQKEVRLIAGPGVFICYECVDMCLDIKWEKEPPVISEPEKYRVTYSVLHATDAYQDFDTVEGALAFTQEWLIKEENFISRHRTNLSKITKVRERDL